MIQVVKAASINSSNITLIGRDLVINNNEPFENQPIYFIFGDSDIQSHIYKTKNYFYDKSLYENLEKALMLLLAFKPLSTNIVLAPSSIIQSHITKQLFEKYNCFYDNTNKHIFAIRREFDWYDFFHKRMDNTATLREHERYKYYYDKDMMKFVSTIPAYQKIINTGINCSDFLLNKTNSIINDDFTFCQFNGIVNRILQNSILVWEELEKELSKITISTNVTKEIQKNLVVAYTMTIKDSYLMPFNMVINNINYIISTKSKYYFLDLMLMENIIKSMDSYDIFFSLTPIKLYRLISSQGFHEFKFLLEKDSFTASDFLFNAKKYKRKFMKIITSYN